MRYLLKQKLFSLGDDFHILDENGAKVFFVDGKVFSIGDKLSFQDMQGNELALIREKVISFVPHYLIEADGEVVARVKKRFFSLFHCKYDVDGPGEYDLEVKGNFTDWEYTFFRHGAEVAWVSKRFFALRDTYGVDIADGENAILILAATVVIDMACHKDHEGSNDNDGH
jgi:uncharacterized protein YxjI